MQQAAGDDHFAAEVLAALGDDALQGVVLHHLIGVVDGDQLVVEPELHQGVDRLAVSAGRELFAGDAVGEAGDVDDLLVGVQKLWLAAGFVLGFEDERGEAAVGRREAGGQARGTGADDHDVPPGQLAEIEVFVEFGDFEVGHGTINAPVREFEASGAGSFAFWTEQGGPSFLLQNPETGRGEAGHFAR